MNSKPRKTLAVVFTDPAGGTAPLLTNRLAQLDIRIANVVIATIIVRHTSVVTERSVFVAKASGISRTGDVITFAEAAVTVRKSLAKLVFQPALHVGVIAAIGVHFTWIAHGIRHLLAIAAIETMSFALVG